MVNLKLSKLPDRTPIKIAISVLPELKRALDDYAALYAATYGQEESVAELIPAMLEAFLASDRAFARARRAQPEHGELWRHRQSAEPCDVNKGIERWTTRISGHSESLQDFWDTQKARSAGWYLSVLKGSLRASRHSGGRGGYPRLRGNGRWRRAISPLIVEGGHATSARAIVS